MVVLGEASRQTHQNGIAAGMQSGTGPYARTQYILSDVNLNTRPNCL